MINTLNKVYFFMIYMEKKTYLNPHLALS